MARSAEELKQLSIKEFTEAAKVYESVVSRKLV